MPGETPGKRFSGEIFSRMPKRTWANFAFRIADRMSLHIKDPPQSPREVLRAFAVICPEFFKNSPEIVNWLTNALFPAIWSLNPREFKNEGLI
jgi:hypothetical protein